MKTSLFMKKLNEVKCQSKKIKLISCLFGFLLIPVRTLGYIL